MKSKSKGQTGFLKQVRRSPQAKGRGKLQVDALLKAAYYKFQRDSTTRTIVEQHLGRR